MTVRAVRRLAVWGALATAPAAMATTVSVEPDGAVLSRSPLHLQLTLAEAPVGAELSVEVAADGRSLGSFDLGNGTHALQVERPELAPGRRTIEVTAAGVTSRREVTVLPGWVSVLPPLIAIGLALAFKEVLLSLFLGVFSGALLLYGGNPLRALARTADTFVAPSVGDPDQASILVFTVFLGGMVGLITKSGGTHGIVEKIKGFATSARRGQVATWFLGLLVFFDDYANTLIVGSTMRPVTDRVRVSREKLAYIVDSTAAPVASIAPISAWIGFEVGLIAAAFTALDLPLNAYATFIASIPYRFYPLLALVLGLTVALSDRDIGPMAKAERRARSTGKVLADGAVPLADFGAERLAPADGTPRRAINALLPILAVGCVAVVGMYVSGAAGLQRSDYPGAAAWLREVFGNADSYSALLWASLAGVLVAASLPIAQRILSVTETMRALVEGFKSMLMALVVLVLAWSIGSVCDQLHTADYVVSLTREILSPHWLPVLVFLISAAVAFATGSSWGTLGILMPLVVPIAHGLATDHGFGLETTVYSTVLVGTISSVLAGSVWGDHCSPISDTTILSSTASGCDHIAHVRTQMPYALSVGILGMLVGDIPTAFGMSPWISLLAGTAIIVGGMLWLGRRPTDA